VHCLWRELPVSMVRVTCRGAISVTSLKDVIDFLCFER